MAAVVLAVCAVVLISNVMSDNPAIFLTGGARRVGRVIALHFAKLGHPVVLHYNHSQVDAEDIKQLIEATGGTCHLIQADLLDHRCYEPLITQAREAFPSLQMLIHNASTFEAKTFADSQEQDYHSNMALHVQAPFFLSQAFASQVNKGSIVTMLDTYVTKQSRHHFTYLFSKKCLKELTMMLAHELAPNIRVNAIAPGLILPSFGGGQAELEAHAIRVPLQKLGTPQDIADMIYHYYQSDYLTGHISYIDGGEQLGLQ